jgi:hypothetical protein
MLYITFCLRIREIVIKYSVLSFTHIYTCSLTIIFEIIIDRNSTFMDGAIWEYVVHLSMQSIFFDLLTVKCLQLKSQNNRKLKEKSPLPPKPPKFPSTFSDEPVSSAGDYDSPISVLSVSPIIIVSAGFIVIPINDIIDVKNIIFMIPENINHWNPYSIGIHVLI